MSKMIVHLLGIVILVASAVSCGGGNTPCNEACRKAMDCANSCVGTDPTTTALCAQLKSAAKNTDCDKEIDCSGDAASAAATLNKCGSLDPAKACTACK